METEQKLAIRVIHALGGTAATARLCEVKYPSVSDWKLYGIPKARKQFLKLLRPDLFASPKRTRRAKGK